MKKDHRSWDDAALGAALRAASPPPPLDEVDWDGLHDRVVASARRVLARVQVRRSWWDVTAAWATRGIPITATAAAAAALVLALVGPPAPPAAETGGLIAFEEALAGDAAPLLTATDPDEALANAILYYDEEGW